MATPQSPIAIFDSGVGGLTVVRAVRDTLPAENLIYFGDTARVPYGSKSPDTVRRYSLEIGRFLAAMDVKCIVVACNTASALALDSMRAALEIPVLGVVVPGAAAGGAATRNGHIGVIGTRATVASGAYQLAINECHPNAHVFTKSCPLFVPLVEEMWLDTPTTREVIAHYLDPLLNNGIDTLLLGCTHYPFLHSAIAHHCGRDVTVVDSARTCADALAQLLLEHSLLAPSDPSSNNHHHNPGIQEVLLTDTPDRFLPLANDFLDLAIDTARIRPVPTESLST
ncbi:glutamate racemase [soil metagenome]